MSTAIDQEEVPTDVDDSRLEEVVISSSEDDVSDEGSSIFGDSGAEDDNVSQSQFILFIPIVWVYHVIEVLLLVSNCVDGYG